MAVVTLAQLRTRARNRADMAASKFVTDAELNDYINAAAQELYDLLVAANVDYYNVTQLFTLSGNQSTYTLPSTLYKLRGVDENIDGSWVPLAPYEFLERGRFQDSFVARLITTIRYRLSGYTLDFLPADQASGDYRVIYVPLMSVMVSDSDTFDGVNGFEEFIVVTAARVCKIKEESAVGDLDNDMARLLRRIAALGSDRDQGSVAHVADVRRNAL